VDVRIESVNAKGGWNAVAADSGKPVRIKDARQIRRRAGDGERTVEPADDAAPEGDGDLVPLTALDKEKKRGRKKTKGTCPPTSRPWSCGTSTPAIVPLHRTPTPSRRTP
jgi:hypothetical protein